MYQIAKFCESKFKLLLKDFSSQLKNLFKFKYNASNLFHYLKQFITSTLASLNLQKPQTIKDYETINQLRLFLDYKSFDLNITETICKVHINDTTFPAVAFYKWFNDTMISAINKNQSFYTTFTSSFHNSVSIKKTKLSLNTYLAGKFFRFNNTNTRIKPTNTNTNITTTNTNIKNDKIKKRQNKPNELVNAKKLIVQKLKNKPDIRYELKTATACAMYNAFNKCRKGQRCPRKHLCIICELPHSLINCLTL